MSKETNSSLRLVAGLDVNKEGGFLFGRFELLEVLGEGNISTVYKCVDHQDQLQSDGYVTVKVLHRRFKTKQEWQALKGALGRYHNLDHPNIVKTIHCGYSEKDSKVYLISDFLAGESLSKVVRAWHENPIKNKRASYILNEVGQALSHVHRLGAVHGDLKPANIFLTEDGDIRVMDFGLVQALREIARKKSEMPQFGPNNHSASSPAYASPEIIDEKDPDARDDVYALSCIAYEMLCGDHPYGRVRASGAQEFKLEVKASNAFTTAQWNSLSQALAFDREKRTASVTEFLSSFNTSGGASGGSWLRRVVIAAGFVALIVGISGYFGGFHTTLDNLPTQAGNPAPDLSVESNASQSASADQFDARTLDEAVKAALLEAEKQAFDEPLVVEPQPEAKPQPAPVVIEDKKPVKQSKKPTAVAKPSEKPKPSIESLVSALLKRADKQMKAQKLTLPKNDNALASYRQALKLSPKSKAAKQGIQSIKALYNKWSDDARNKGSWKRARDMARKAAAIEPKSNANLQARLKRINAQKAAADQKARQAEIAKVKQQALATGNLQSIIVINEVMAHNDLTLADAQGEYDDWVEFFNRSQKAVDLSGLYLSNDLQEPRKWQFPKGVSIPANGYLIVWADRSVAATDLNANPPQIHTNFNLSPRSGRLLLVGSDRNGNNIIDQINYGRQREDLSVGRFPNGLGDFSDNKVVPTPGAPNIN